MEKNYFSHRLLVFTSSTAFMFIILGVINEVLEIQEAPNAINIFTFIITFFSGIIYVLIQHLFVNEKSNAGVHFRFMIIYMILMMTAAFFIFGRKFNSFIFISLIVQYLITNRIHDLFLRHQIFIIHCEDKKGKALVEHLFRDNLFIKDLGISIKKTQTTLFILSVVSIVMLLILLAWQARLTLYIIVSVFIFFISLFFICICMGFFSKESFYASLGFTETLRNRSRVLKTCCIILLLSLILAIIFSSNSSLIDLSKLLKLSQRLENHYYNQNMIPPDPTPDIANDFRNQLTKLDNREWISEEVMNMILKILKIVFIGVAGIFLIVKFFKPFFSLGWQRFWSESHLYKFFKAVFNEISDFFRLIFLHEKKSEEKYSTVSSRNFLNSMQQVIKKSSKSKKKKLELDRLTKQFVKLIIYSESHGVKYRKNLAPLEYTSMLTDPEFFNTACANKAGMLFEKALYSKDTLTEDEENQFNKNLKDAIIK